MRSVESESWSGMGAALAEAREKQFEQRQAAARQRMQELMRRCADARQSAARRRMKIFKRGGLIPYAGAERRVDIALPAGDVGFQAAEIYEQLEFRPTADLLMDRDRRQAMPYRDLTAMLMGDPRIGQSALDKRQMAKCAGP